MKWALIMGVLTCSLLGSETINVDLSQSARMKLAGVTVEPRNYKGKAALRIDYQSGDDGESVAILPGVDFSDGVIEYDFAGDVKPGSPPEYRGFTGLAFRVAPDGKRYECLYQRPLNAHSPNAEQKMHTVQYMSLPGFGWRKLRTEFPGKYEAWADIAPGEWAHVKIDVKQSSAKASINSREVLSVDELKQGITHGTLALWVGVGTSAYFANLRITR